MSIVGPKNRDTADYIACYLTTTATRLHYLK